MTDTTAKNAPGPPSGESSARIRETTRLAMRDSAGLTAPYMLMNMLAACIATYGLFANSPAVVIGAMIVAMLLGPINGLSLAVVEGDMALLARALFALLAGVAGVMSVAAVLGFVHRDAAITQEILARTAPNLMDLMIALAGGAAGSYATVNPRLSVAFVGVAIATALVPPLCSATILMIRGQMSLGLGALLLAFTNMVAIQFAGSVVLWFTGFQRRAVHEGLSVALFARVNVVSITLVVLLATLLAVNLRRVVQRQLFETQVEKRLAEDVEAAPGAYLASVRFETSADKTIVRAVVRSPAAPTPEHVASMEAKLPPPPDRTTLELRIRFVETQVISASGVLYRDAEFSPAR